MHPARAKPATLTGKRKRNLGKKLRKKLKMAKSAAIKETKKEGRAEEAGRRPDGNRLGPQAGGQGQRPRRQEAR